MDARVMTNSWHSECFLYYGTASVSSAAVVHGLMESGMG